MKFYEGEYAYERGGPVDEIFFVTRGKFGMVLPDFEDFLYVEILPGDYFGDLDYVCEQEENKRIFTVKAMKQSEVYTLNK